MLPLATRETFEVLVGPQVLWFMCYRNLIIEAQVTIHAFTTSVCRVYILHLTS